MNHPSPDPARRRGVLRRALSALTSASPAAAIPGLRPSRAARGRPAGLADPALVAPIRKQVVEQLERWGLQEASFTAELVVSELVTNAIRYGGETVHVRVLRDRSLICEVFDSSSTSPHLRYAAMTDEGGRGLFLVAQLAERWGTRYTPAGKVIWAEQPVP